MEDNNFNNDQNQDDRINENHHDEKAKSRFSLTKNDKKSRPLKKAMANHITVKTALIAVLLIGLLGAGAYFGNRAYTKGYIKAKQDIAELQGNKAWQQNQINDLHSFRDFANNQINDQNVRLNNLETSLMSPGSESFIGDGTIPSASITIEGATTVNLASEADPDSNDKLVIIDILLVNNTSTDVYFSSGQYKLKDQNNYEYNISGEYSYGYGGTTGYIEDLPGDRVALSYTTLKPGEKARGSLVFKVTRPVSKFNLYDTQTGQAVKEISV